MKRSKSGWATPNSLSPGTQCRVIALPADLDLWEAISGALYALTDPLNWEEVGSVSAEDVAQFFQEWWAEYQDSTYPCEGNFVEDVRIQNGRLEAKIAGEWVDKGVAAAVGQIGLYALETLPENVLICDGTTYLREDYPDLFTVLGAAFIVDEDHFQVPDLRDRVPVGSGGTLGDVGDTGGEKSHVLTEGELAPHDHDVIDQHLGSTPSGGLYHNMAPDLTYNNYTAYTTYVNGEKGATHPAFDIQDAGGGAAHNNLQPYQILVYGIIAQ